MQSVFIAIYGVCVPLAGFRPLLAEGAKASAQESGRAEFECGSFGFFLGKRDVK